MAYGLRALGRFVRVEDGFGGGWARFSIPFFRPFRVRPRLRFLG